MRVVKTEDKCDACGSGIDVYGLEGLTSAELEDLHYICDSFELASLPSPYMQTRLNIRHEIRSMWEAEAQL